MWLFFCYTTQLITIKLCTKFQNPKSSSCLEIFDRKKSLQTDRQTNRQTNKHNYRKGKNYIPPIYFVPGYKKQNNNLFITVLSLSSTVYNKTIFNMEFTFEYIWNFITLN